MMNNSIRNLDILTQQTQKCWPHNFACMTGTFVAFFGLKSSILVIIDTFWDWILHFRPES